MMTINRLLENAMIQFSDRRALEIGEHSWTYDELLGSAFGLARSLPGWAPIGILGQSSEMAIRGVLSALIAGRCYVPLNPKWPANRIQSLVEASGIDALIVDENTKELLPKRDLQNVAVLDAFDKTAQQRSAVLADDIPCESTAYLMYTSGSTGRPKGVRVLRRNIEAYIEGIRGITPLKPEDRATHLFDLSFDLSVHDILVTLTSGACLCVATELDKLDLVSFVAQKRITSWFSVPSMIAFANRARPISVNDMPTLRLSLFCGEALPVSLTQIWAQGAPNTEIWNMYGPTETTIAVAAYRYEHVKRDDYGTNVPLGHPLPGQMLRLARVSDLENELEIAGTQVSAGYVGADPAAEAHFYVDDGIRWYKSGDLAEFHDAHGFVFRGRLDDQVKVSGYRIEPGEIEHAVRRETGLSEVAVVTLPPLDDGLIVGLVAFVVGTYTVPECVVLAKLGETLPHYMTPVAIVTLQELPRNSNGKIDRVELRRLAEKLERPI